MRVLGLINGEAGLPVRLRFGRRISEDLSSRMDAAARDVLGQKHGHAAKRRAMGGEPSGSRDRLVGQKR